MKEHTLGVDLERAGAMLADAVRETIGGRRATVYVQTDRHSYLGTLHVPEGKTRILDVLCDGRPFLNLTDVSTDGVDGMEPLLVLNKAMIQCLRFVGVSTPTAPRAGDCAAR